MYGVNIGLEIGRRALLSAQYALNTNGHNIANVNTPGFTRQQAMMISTQPFDSNRMQFGTGVKVDSVRRIRSYFLDEQFRQETQRMGRWQTLSYSWEQVERIFVEPSDNGFGSLLEDFWNSWQDLSISPDSMAARSAVREQANLLINGLHQMNNQMTDLQKSIDDDIQKSVEYINEIANQLASLNETIQTAELSGHQANDLRDRRDLLVDELSDYINVEVLEQPNGNYTVFVGSMAFVDGNTVSNLELSVRDTGTTVIHDIKFANSPISPEIVNGKLAGYIETRDEIVPERLAELDQLALSLVEQLNELHKDGYSLNGETNICFFDPDTTGAADIKLDDLIIADEGYISASLNGETGDNSNALRIAGLRHELVMNNGTATINDFYNSIVGIIGIKTNEALNMAENQTALVFHIENSKQSLEGVSLDEEMTNMIKYEHAYEAAARVITAMDDALNTIINNMG
ncbi:MAG: flagellar hook-associated protein FlgK [candidate division Zixibacteria bacterium]|nr:flagellar hook-associated protein FlgK [candidate division Zixibacteria bacterium]